MYCILFENGKPTMYSLDAPAGVAVKAVISLMQLASEKKTVRVAVIAPAKKRRPQRFTAQRACVVCKRMFTIRAPTQRICSPACAKKHEKAKK